MSRLHLLSSLYLLVYLLLSLPCLYSALPDGFVEEAVFQGGGMGFPTDLVFTPEEMMIVVQKKGLVTVWQHDGVNYMYEKLSDALDLSAVTCDNGERGLGSVQIHPNFTTNRYVYLYYTYDPTQDCGESATTGPVNRLSRYTMNPNNNWKLENEVVILQTPPCKKRYHNGGKIEFGKSDGYMYISIGDGGDAGDAQLLNNLFGSMIRITDTGEIPPDNPFASTGIKCGTTGQADSTTAKCAELYAIGLRNPWKFSMNPNSVQHVEYYINDVGGNTWEEVSAGGDIIHATNAAKNVHGIVNYGWPAREGPCARYETTDCDDYEGYYTHPIHYSYHQAQGAAFTGGAFIPNGIWPAEEYDNGYLYTNYVEGVVYLIKPGTNGNDIECLTECNPVESNANVIPFLEMERIPAMRFGPYVGNTMALYYTSNANNGLMKRVYYSGSGSNGMNVVPPNQPPVAAIDVVMPSSSSSSSLWVAVGGTLQFSAASSTDPEDGNMLLYEWDFNYDGVVDSRQVEDSFTFPTAGSYTVQLTVEDSQGLSDTTTVRINVGTPTNGGYPGVLFPWSTNCSNAHDYCGVLEMCADETDSSILGYRLPCSSSATGATCECRKLPSDAPLIRLQPGNKYKLTLRNTAGEVSNLHTHGLHIVGAGDSDDVTRKVQGDGHCLDYTWDIKADHPGGTYWYHAHHHGMSEHQVGGGAYGMLIIEDNTELDSVLPSWASNEHLLQVVKSGDDVLGNGKEGDDVLVVNANQWYRLRVSFVNVDAVPYNFTFDSDDCDVHKVATDGIWRSVVPGPASNKYEMTGASRADFAVRCNTPGTFIPLKYGDGLAATLFVGSAEPNPHVMQQWSPNRPDSLLDMRDVTVSDANKITVRLGYDHVNDLSWDPTTPLATIGYDEVHEWVIRGTSEHPFHLHLYHMQIVTPGGCGVYEEGEFYDVIAAPDDCTIRFKTADIGQMCVLHCHVLFHEDNGSMSWVNVTGPNMPENNVQSYQYTCAADASPIVTEEVTTPSDVTYPSCNPIPIITGGQSVNSVYTILSPQRDRYVILQDNGNFAIFEGTPENPGGMIWSNDIVETSGEYTLFLQKDGNLVLRQINIGLEETSRFVWHSGRHDMSSEVREYFLAFNCDGESVSIYAGTPDAPGTEIWTTRDGGPVTSEVATLNPPASTGGALPIGNSMSVAEKVKRFYRNYFTSFSV